MDNETLWLNFHNVLLSIFQSEYPVVSRMNVSKCKFFNSMSKNIVWYIWVQSAMPGDTS